MTAENDMKSGARDHPRRVKVTEEMSDRVTDLLRTFPVVLPLRVAWGEMDAFGHLNNTVFFRYFEAARIEYMGRIVMNSEDPPEGVGPILHSTSARFRIPLRYPDTAWTGARVTEIADDRFVMAYRVVSARHEAVAADGGGIVVAYDYSTGRKATLPGRVRDAIERLEGS